MAGSETVVANIQDLSSVVHGGLGLNVSRRAVRKKAVEATEGKNRPAPEGLSDSLSEFGKHCRMLTEFL